MPEIYADFVRLAKHRLDASPCAFYAADTVRDLDLLGISYLSGCIDDLEPVHVHIVGGLVGAAVDVAIAREGSFGCNGFDVQPLGAFRTPSLDLELFQVLLTACLPLDHDIIVFTAGREVFQKSAAHQRSSENKKREN